LLGKGKQLYVLWLYLAEATNSTPLFKMCMQISIYLFHWLVHIGLRQLISSMKELFNNILSHIHGIHWIKLAPSSIGISFPALFTDYFLAF
jgi:hypothetical protein